MIEQNLDQFIYGGAAIIGAEDCYQVDDNNLVSLLKEYVKNETIITVKISGISSDSVTTNICGYRGIIPKSEVSNRMYVRNKMGDLINRTVPVIVKSFNPEEKTVQLSRIKAIRRLREEFVNRIVPELGTINKFGVNYRNYPNFLEAKDPYWGKYPVVKAKVLQIVNKNGKPKVIVNIAGLDLIGVMDLSKMDYKYIYDQEMYFEEFLKPNSVIEVALLAYFEKTDTTKASNFVVSRRHAMPNPWKGIETRIKKDDIIVVKAMQKRDRFFFASYDNFPLDIKCYYPADKVDNEEAYGRRLVKEGELYKVAVVAVSEEKRLLTARYLEKL